MSLPADSANRCRAPIWSGRGRAGRGGRRCARVAARTDWPLPDIQPGERLASLADGVRAHALFQRAQRRLPTATSAGESMNPAVSTEQALWRTFS